MQGEGKVKKGWLAVRVGDEDQPRRFVIPIAYLYHPLFRRLLEAARDAYGYDSSGPLRLPCSVDEFLRLRALIDGDKCTRCDDEDECAADGCVCTPGPGRKAIDGDDRTHVVMGCCEAMLV